MSAKPSVPAPTPSANVSVRDWRVDFLRVFACVGVVLLHTTGQFQNPPTPTFTGAALVLVHDLARTAVPLFFMLAGSLALPGIRVRGDVLLFWRKRSLRVWLPTLLWSVIYACLYLADKGGGAGRLSASSLTGLLTDWLVKGKPGAGYHLWFLYVLVVLELAAPWLELFRRRSALCRRLTFAALCLLLACFAVYTLDAVAHGGDGRSTLPFPLLALGYLPWYFLGARLRERLDLIPTTKRVGASIAALAAATLGVVSAALTTYALGYGYGRSDFLPPGVAAAVGIWSVVFLCVKAPAPGVCAVLRRSASLSMGVYLVHVAVLAIVSRFLFDAETGNLRHDAPASLAAAVTTILLSAVAAALAKRLPLLKRLV